MPRESEAGNGQRVAWRTLHVATTASCVTNSQTGTIKVLASRDIYYNNKRSVTIQ